MNGLVLLAAALGIVLVVFVIGLIAALGGELGKFKRLAKKAIAKPTAANFQQTAKDMPVRVRKQYKKAKQSGEKPSDVITVDACVYRPFRSSAAARLQTKGISARGKGAYARCVCGLRFWTILLLRKSPFL